MMFMKIVVYDVYDFVMVFYGVYWCYVRRICVNELFMFKWLESIVMECREEFWLLVWVIYEVVRKDEVIDF